MKSFRPGRSRKTVTFILAMRAIRRADEERIRARIAANKRAVIAGLIATFGGLR